ncbi:hypothetical protein ANAPC3_01104 [Anaplasma phagocytophilum]|nr:hypothetical protein ANAPC2_01062 [Anaplasma phagocytophilum]SBO33107.1 hypothetical protein ANAPC4_01036 [Anaplasma phagocytophilum]SBO33111.1 hypothetical protein ANAPC3_01104 [Anaplasma phagocytophilum]
MTLLMASENFSPISTSLCSALSAILRSSAPATPPMFLRTYCAFMPLSDRVLHPDLSSKFSYNSKNSLSCNIAGFSSILPSCITRLSPF